MSASRSPVPSLDIRRGRPGNFTADSAIPGLDINPPRDTDGKSPGLEEDGDQSRGEGIGGWISRMVKRTKSDDKVVKGDGASYRRLDQEDD